MLIYSVTYFGANPWIALDVHVDVKIKILKLE